SSEGRAALRPRRRLESPRRPRQGASLLRSADRGRTNLRPGAEGARVDVDRHGAEVGRRELRRMPQVRRHRGRRYWVRILLANFVGALAVAGINGGLAPGIRAAALARSFVVAMIYANVIGTLAAVAMPRVAGACWQTPARRRWAILLTSMAVVT